MSWWGSHEVKYFFLGGGQPSYNIFLGIYSWDHDMYLIDSPWFCWVSDRFWMDLVVGKAEVDMEVGAEVVEAKEEEKKEKKEKEKEDNKIGVAVKSFHYCHAWCRFVIAILGLAKGVPFVDLFSCFF